MTDENPAEKKPGPSRKAIIGWSVGMFAVLGLAWFVGAVVVPAWQLRAEIEELGVESKLPAGRRWGRSNLSDETDARALWLVERMGGGRRASARLRQYLGMPRFAAPNRLTAVYLLGFCEGYAVEALVGLLEDEDPRIRTCSIESLGMIGPEARAAAPRLKARLKDDDKQVREAAGTALWSVLREPSKFDHLDLSALYDVDEEGVGPVEKDLSKSFARNDPGYLIGELKVAPSHSGSSNFVVHEPGKKNGWSCGAYLSREHLGRVREGRVYKFYGELVSDGHKGYITTLVVYEVREP